MSNRIPVVSALALFLLRNVTALGMEARPCAVDFCYSPPEWQTAICLPDDPQKSLVDKSGELLYHYNEGGREFATHLGVEVASNAVWRAQELDSPRVPIVRTHLAGDGLEILEETFAVTGLAQPTAPAPPETTNTGPARNDLMLVHVTNTGSDQRTIRPALVVDTTFPFTFDRYKQRVQVNHFETITASLRLTGVEEKASRRAIQLEELTVPAGQTARFFVLYSGGGSIVIDPVSVEQALACREHAVAYWQALPLPYNRVQVPDPGIQALVDSSIRNIWQAREIKKGLPAFQVGPTCYRGLWIVDGAFLLEAAAMLGESKDARNGVAYELTYSNQTGASRSCPVIGRKMALCCGPACGTRN